MKKAFFSGLAGLLALSAGCGTMENLRGPEGKGAPRAYGGVAADFRACQQIPRETVQPEWSSGMGVILAHSQTVRFCLRVIDMPFSFAADTLTLPLVVFADSPPSDGATTRDPGREIVEDHPGEGLPVREE